MPSVATDQRLDVYENACTGAIDAGPHHTPRGRGEEGGEKDPAPMIPL